MANEGIDAPERDVRPLSAEERAELEQLRAEKAAHERQELERLREEHAALSGVPSARAGAVDAHLPASHGSSSTDATVASREVSAPDEETRRIVEARARGRRLMQPDEETLAMPVGQKVVLAVIAIVALVGLVLLIAPLG